MKKLTLLLLLTVLSICAGNTKAEELPSFVQYARSVQDKAAAGDANAKGIVADLMVSMYLPGGNRNGTFLAMEASSKGSPIGKYVLGCSCYDGLYDKVDKVRGSALVQEALPGIQAMAENGDLYAQTVMGWIRLQGQAGTQKDEAAGVAWLQKAADSGFAPAELAMFKCYFAGQGVAEDKQVAMKWLEKACVGGDPEARLLARNHVDFLGYRVTENVRSPLNPRDKICVAAYFRCPRFPRTVFSVLLLIGNVPPSPEGSSCTVDYVEGMASNEYTGIPIYQTAIESKSIDVRNPMRIGFPLSKTVYLYDDAPCLYYGPQTRARSVFDVLFEDYPKFHEWALKAHEINPVPFTKSISPDTVFKWSDSQATISICRTDVGERYADAFVTLGPEVDQVKE